MRQTNEKHCAKNADLFVLGVYLEGTSAEEKREQSETLSTFVMSHLDPVVPENEGHELVV